MHLYTPTLAFCNRYTPLLPWSSYCSALKCCQIYPFDSFDRDVAARLPHSLTDGFEYFEYGMANPADSATSSSIRDLAKPGDPLALLSISRLADTVYLARILSSCLPSVILAKHCSIPCPEHV